MATASPTPAPTGLVRRTSQRQALRRPTSRSQLTRAESEQPVSTRSRAAPQQPQQYNDDSSEDEIPVPMKLSALTKALLSDVGGPEPAASRPVQPSPPRTRRRTSALNTSTSSSSESRRYMRSGSAQAQDVEGTADNSQVEGERERSPVRKRVVRLSSNSQSVAQMGSAGSKRRSTSSTRPNARPTAPSRPQSRTENREPRERPAEEKQEAREDINTPAQGGRVVRIVTGSSGKHSRVGSSGPSSGRSMFDRSVADKSVLDGDHGDYAEGPETVARNAPAVSFGSIARYPSTSTKNRQEDPNPQSSMRVKRVGKIPGSFLSGPARRGRRRQSEEDGEEIPEGEMNGQELGSQPGDEVPQSSFYADRDFNSGSPVSSNAASRAVQRRQASNAELRNSARPSPRHQERQEDLVDLGEVHVHVPNYRAQLPAAHDQENEVPASYKRSKPSVDDILQKIPHRPLQVESRQERKASPERKALAPITNNTPHRAAPPPPPKMSVLEAATSTAGAATTTQAKQRRNILKVNGKCYTRLDCRGRGGSAKVYRVTAENGKMFALKRVSLENADELTVRGYRGEIDLLTRLSTVDRVIKLFDYEMNEEKQVLTLLMEMGELDFNTHMRARQDPETPRFDPIFVRFYWKEMLECLQAVHEFDIVHSDLKPANFVLVRGQLKLIDFGIANAIQTDETVNVHRETQVGTPNYMSPESLIDSNPRSARMPGRSKLMKVGKPSDVWSLGCILYQLVYGMPPFGHIANQMARCQAIINWDHAIEFPSRAMGGVSVPPSLLRTLKRCLNRDHHMRPTCEELLHATDPFLYPAELSEKALPIDEELLGRIIQSVVTRCRERMPTEAEIMSVWPQAYWASVRKAMASRM